jgi:hypothetical protein
MAEEEAENISISAEPHLSKRPETHTNILVDHQP